MKLKGDMVGARQVVDTLRRIATKFPDRVAAALYQEAAIEMTEAKRRTPVDTTPHAPHPGQLRNSGHVRPPVRRGRQIFVTLAFGTDYAVYVHENPDAIHPIGQWKFLESVINESRPHMAGRLARRIHLNEMKG